MISAGTAKNQTEGDYSWPNPVTGNVESKHTYFRKVDDMLVGVGYYARRGLDEAAFVAIGDASEATESASFVAGSARLVASFKGPGSPDRWRPQASEPGKGPLSRRA
jgi:hypothetical protein